MKDERGEIATLLTIGTLVVIGVTAVVSSLFVNNKNTVGSRASTGCTEHLKCATYGGSAYGDAEFSMKDGNYYACGDCSCTSKGQSGWIGVCTKTGTGSGGTFSFSCSYNEKIVGEATQCTASTACGSSEVVGDKVDTENAKRHCCCKPASGGTTCSGDRPKKCGEVCCKETDNCGYNGSTMGCQTPAATNCTSGPKSCMTVKPEYAKGQYWVKGSDMYKDAACNEGIPEGVGNYCRSLNTTSGGGCDDNNWLCLGECASSSVRSVFSNDSARWRTEKMKNCNKSTCDGTCSTTTAPCGGAPKENMCPDGNEVNRYCINEKDPSNVFVCCGPHNNPQYPTANYATWRKIADGGCGGATGLENLPAGCCFKNSDCDKYGSGQICNIPNGACGGAGGLSCNSNKDGKYQQQCVNQQCVNQPCDASGCDPNKYCADNSKCQQQYGGFTCPEKDTAHNGKGYYNWADGNGKNCICMNCKVYGTSAANYYCSADNQNYVDGSLCCADDQPGKGSTTCDAYNQNVCGINGKGCCPASSGKKACNDGLSCDTASNTCKPSTCKASNGATVQNDGKAHCAGQYLVAKCDGTSGKVLESKCDGVGSTGNPCTENGSSDGTQAGCNKPNQTSDTAATCGGASNTCTDSACQKATGNANSKTDPSNNHKYWVTATGTLYYNPVPNNTTICSSGTLQSICACSNPTTGGTGSCSGTALKCSDYCKDTYSTSKPNAEKNNNYWYDKVNAKYFSDYTGVGTCKEDSIANICVCTATPVTGDGDPSSCSGTKYAHDCTKDNCAAAALGSTPGNNTYWQKDGGTIYGMINGACKSGTLVEACACSSADTSNLGTNACLEGGKRKECGKTIGSVVRTQTCTDPAGWAGTSKYSPVCAAASPWYCEYYGTFAGGDGTKIIVDWNRNASYPTEAEAKAYTYCERNASQSRTFGVSLNVDNLADLKPATLTSGSICLLASTNGPTVSCKDINAGDLSTSGQVNMDFTVGPTDSVEWINATVFDNNQHTYQANVKTRIDEYTPPQAGGYGLRININNPVK